MSTAETTVKTIVEKYRDLLLDITGNLFILGLLLLLLHHFTSVIVSIWIDISLLTIITFASGFGYFLIYIQKDEEYFKTKTEPYFRNLFLAGLLIVTTGSLTFDFIENNELLNSLVSFIFSLQFYFVLATIGFGFITFYFNRERIETETQLEKEQEDQAERKRAEEFDSKFAFLTRFDLDYGISENWNRQNYAALAIRGLIAPFVWVMRLPYSSGKWMYREGQYTTGIILIIAIYFYVQFSMFQYPGNYPDEYHHIITAKSLLETGNYPILNDINGGYYTRGAPLSYLVAFSFSLFGMNLFTAKIVPIFLGLINLLFLYEISKKIILDNKIRYVLLLTFILSSWLIFNHFYIRHYVFLEFMLLFMAFLMCKLYDAISNKNPNILLYIFTIILANIFHYMLMDDITAYIIPIATAFGFIYLFVFSTHKIEIKQNKLKKLFNTSIEMKLVFLVLFFSTIVLVISNFINIPSLINSLLFGQTNTGPDHFNFNSFFFGIYLYFTIFFVIGVITNIMSKHTNKIILSLVTPLLLLHYISSESNQIMRLMVYLLPLFYLFTFYGLEKVINTFQSKKIATILFIFFIITTAGILQDDNDRIFEEGYPQIPGEIGYHEYKPMYDYLKNNCSEYVIINTEYNIQRERFFGVNTDYKLDFKNVVDNHYTHYYDKNAEIYRQIYTDTPVIKNKGNYKSIISNEKVCIVLSGHANHFLEKSDIDYIKKNFTKKKEFVGFTIYSND
jgi:hypothetical protein